MVVVVALNPQTEQTPRAGLSVVSLLIISIGRDRCNGNLGWMLPQFLSPGGRTPFAVVWHLV